MKIYYDTEFIENGKTIDLISIGMVADDGQELYLINEQAPLTRICEHEWLMANVVPSLPLALSNQLVWNKLHPDYGLVMYPWKIAERILMFLGQFEIVELWAWYGAYDHVALAQLWGPMIKLPKQVPMWTNDLRQEVVRLGDPQLPEQPEGEHNALVDARHLKLRAEWLAGLK